MKKERTWGWPIAGYLFMGGLGGGMMLVSTVAHLFFSRGGMFIIGDFVAAVLIGFGSGLLIFELGRPLQFWRVFSKERAILTFGAWMLSLFMVSNIMYGLCNLSLLPWCRVDGLSLALGWVCLLLGLGVVLYTGIFLGAMKARPFWNGPALPILFLVSSLSTGVAAQSLLIHFWPLGSTEIEAETIDGFLRSSDIGLLVLELIVVFVYVLTMRFSTTVSAARAAATWLGGSKALWFWVGLIGIGLLCPLLLYCMRGTVALVIAPVFVLAGGLILRFLVIYTADRIVLPGDEIFYELREIAGF